MYQTGQDLAEAALRLLKCSRAPRTSEEALQFADHVLAAAILATQVCDWHFVRGLGKQRADTEDKQAFAIQYPEWDAVRKIANGTKHPEGGTIDISTGSVRRIEWEDLDFWEADHDLPTLVIADKNEFRSVDTLVSNFCRAYLARQLEP
jgi:hypothetical protein